MEEAMKAMATVNLENVAQDFRPLLVIYKDGTIHRFLGTQTVPPSLDPTTGVESQDVTIQEGGVWVRLYKPRDETGTQRFPVLVYFHGGAFSNESAASPTYHYYLNKLACKANVIVVSVDYRRAPEHPLPAAYEDSWAAIEWVENGHDGHPWIRDSADLNKVFLAGDSAGANIAHHMAKRIGKGHGKGHLKLKGTLLVHPFFWGKERIGSEEEKIKNLPVPNLSDKLWALVCPGSNGIDDPLINPGMDPELADLGGEKVMVCVAEQDMLRDRGVNYKEVLVKSGCKANVELVETSGENHVFHLLTPDSPNVEPFMDQVVAFLNSA